MHFFRLTLGVTGYRVIGIQLVYYTASCFVSIAIRIHTYEPNDSQELHPGLNY